MAMAGNKKSPLSAQSVRSTKIHESDRGAFNSSPNNLKVMRP